MRILPIIFKTEMVRAILDERKTVTRRKIDIDISNQFDVEVDGSVICYIDPETGDTCSPEKVCRYQPGDILYVRETYVPMRKYFGADAVADYIYKADCTAESERIRNEYGIPWTPSIHMPKAAARIWLKVTDVRVEQLQDITEEQAKAEGISEEWAMSWWSPTYNDPDSGGYPEYRKTFGWELWDSTIKKSDLALYGWNANPWVEVTEFEWCEKPEEAE